LNYFGKYGSIVQWKILGNGRTFLLTFEDYDSVDRIILDQPHFVNEHILSIQKCYTPYSATSSPPVDDRLKEKIRNLKASIERSKYLHESELIKLKKQIQEETAVEENHLAEIMKLHIRLERIQRDLKQDLNNVHQINQRLKKQLRETMQKNGRIVDEFENQLEQQRSINKSLQESISNFAQIQ
jgi:predicted RNase H-like nuclease (RuvC/YqgF family)